jgi:molybdate-binding protein
LRSELERTFAVAFDDAAHVVTLYASHDDALSALREHALHLDKGALHLDIRFTGSVDAIRALNEGRCVMAGFHTLALPAPDSLAERTYKPLLQPGRHKVIGFANRAQGLMVAPGNPMGIHTLQDVIRLNARFANRALGTGTRLLLDEMLEKQGLRHDQVNGFDRTETSHAAVAQAVASGQANAGLGIEAAARARGLDFVALAQERYHLVCLKEALDEPPVAALRQVLQSADWQEAMNRIAGYRSAQSGEVLALSQILPWWKFKKRSPAGLAIRA